MSVAVVLVKPDLDRAAMGALGAGQRLRGAATESLTAYVPDSMSGPERERVAQFATLVYPMHCLNEGSGPEGMLNPLCKLLAESTPEIMIFDHGTYTQEIAPRLAFRLGGACITDALSAERAEERVQVTRAAYGGKAVATFVVDARPAVLSVRGHSQSSPSELETSGSMAPVATCEPSDLGVELVEDHVEAVDGVRLEDASVVVSGGRGLGSAAPFERLKALAEPMNAEMAASRAACDLGWVPHSWQVGQTGKKIAPELYLAVALSGSSQHLMGIADAKQIAAINVDPDAPIFKHCRFGIVEDYDKVVDLLREKLIGKLS